MGFIWWLVELPYWHNVPFWPKVREFNHARWKKIIFPHDRSSVKTSLHTRWDWWATKVIIHSYGSFPLTETDSGIDSDLDSELDGYIVLCRTCSRYTDSDSDPYSLFLYRTGIWVRVPTRIWVRQCKWASILFCYWPHTKFAKVMFLHLSVCSQEGVSASRTGVSSRRVGKTPTHWILRDTVNEQAVRILLEYILSLYILDGHLDLGLGDPQLPDPRPVS